MKTSEIIDKISLKTGVSPDIVKKVIKGFGEVLLECINTKQNFIISGVFTIKTKIFDSKYKINPRTLEKVYVGLTTKVSLKLSDVFKNNIK